MKIEKNKKLLNYNFYKINAVAENFVELKNKKDFLEVFKYFEKNKIKKFFILGGGANIIFVKEKYDGVVIKISNTFTR
jgi:UDP-N-acetylenolpyruvoylglucosamine reductase